MARKYGKINAMSTDFSDYSYIINGVGGIGKTTMAYEIGKLATGSDEGTFIITLGEEPEPKHIPNAFGDVAPDFKTFISIVKELCENKAEYPYTKFIAFDSMDELCRITEQYVIDEWNATCDIKDKAKSISQAYKGFQKGENRTIDLMLKYLGKLKKFGYQFIEIGHTKVKLREDTISGISYEQLTCNLDNKYYNALKDKVNLVATCYLEKTIEDVKEKKNAFTKEMDKIGTLTKEKRVIVFRDDDMAVDTKSHFEFIVPKVEFSSENFIKAVEDAIAEKIKVANIKPIKNIEVKLPMITPKFEDEEYSEAVDETENTNISSEIEDNNLVDKTVLIETIRNDFKNADGDVKKAIKVILSEKGTGKLDDNLSVETLEEIQSLLL